MEAINKDLPLMKFEKPQGISTITINPENNKRAVKNSSRKINEIFIAGTEPTEWDNPEEVALQNDLFESQIETAGWNLNVPFEQKIDEDVFFDFLTKKTNAKEAENSEADESIPTSRSIRLKLQVPSRTQ
jgi:membrane carboxypeptidase/penicillin-binding protein